MLLPSSILSFSISSEKLISLSSYDIKQKQYLKVSLSSLTPEEMKIKPHQVSEFNPNLLEQKQKKAFPLLLILSPFPLYTSNIQFILCFLVLKGLMQEKSHLILMQDTVVEVLSNIYDQIAFLKRSNLSLHGLEKLLKSLKLVQNKDKLLRLLCRVTQKSTNFLTSPHDLFILASSLMLGALDCMSSVTHFFT